MLAALLPLFGPVLLISVALGVSLVTVGSPGWAVAAALAVAIPAVSTAAILGLLYRWCFPQANVRPAGLAAALLVLLMLFSSEDFLALLASPSWLAAGTENLIVAAREVTLAGGLSLIAIMGTVLLIELPMRLCLSGWSGPQQEDAVRSARCVASLLIISAGWLLLEESAVGRLAQLLTLLRG